jgi:hypothetical protein
MGLLDKSYKLIGACYVHAFSRIVDRCATCTYNTTREEITTQPRIPTEYLTRLTRYQRATGLRAPPSASGERQFRFARKSDDQVPQAEDPFAGLTKVPHERPISRVPIEAPDHEDERIPPRVQSNKGTIIPLAVQIDPNPPFAPASPPHTTVAMKRPSLLKRARNRMSVSLRRKREASTQKVSQSQVPSAIDTDTSNLSLSTEEAKEKDAAASEQPILRDKSAEETLNEVALVKGAVLDLPVLQPTWHKETPVDGISVETSVKNANLEVPPDSPVEHAELIPAQHHLLTVQGS